MVTLVRNWRDLSGQKPQQQIPLLAAFGFTKFTSPQLTPELTIAYAQNPPGGSSGGSGSGSSGGGGGGGAAGKGSVAPVTGAALGKLEASNRAMMQRMAAARGWTGNQWNALDQLMMRESGYNNFVWNFQGSGAYGIGQALPASKYPKAGQPSSMGGSSNPQAQIQWTLDYIAGRYTNPVNAWAHETSMGWY